MSKDSYYFSHDYNARSDPKIRRLIRAHGVTGYGIFWAIIEDLYNNANALPTDYDGIAFDLRAECDTVKSIVTEFDLFQFNDGFFSSLSVQRRLDERKQKSQAASDSANYRWNKSKSNANAMRTHSDGNAIKERKENKSKENESIAPELLFKSMFEKTENFNRAKMEASRNDIKGSAFDTMYAKWALHFIEHNDDYMQKRMGQLESSLKRWVIRQPEFAPKQKPSVDFFRVPNP